MGEPTPINPEQVTHTRMQITLLPDVALGTALNAFSARGCRDFDFQSHLRGNGTFVYVPLPLAESLEKEFAGIVASAVSTGEQKRFEPGESVPASVKKVPRAKSQKNELVKVKLFLKESCSDSYDHDEVCENLTEWYQFQKERYFEESNPANYFMTGLITRKNLLQLNADIRNGDSEFVESVSKIKEKTR